MDQHPIPKNVLTVEFKLFGALSVRQFMRVLIGGLIALGLYVLPLHPLIKFPGIIISIAVGVGSALVPGFDVRLFALLKAVFVSPRYVWRKQVRVPEVLNDVAINSKTVVEKAEKAKTEEQENDLTIDQILVARSQVLPLVEQQKQQGEAAGPAIQAIASITRPQPPQPKDLNSGQVKDESEEDRFSRAYEEEFGLKTMEASLQARNANQSSPVSQVTGLAGNFSQKQSIAIGPNMQAALRPLNNTNVRPPTQPLIPPKSTAQNNVPNLLQNYREELTLLQSQLQQLNKNGGDDARKQQILDRINEIYATLKPAAPSTQPVKLPTSELPEIPKRLVYGVVVDKKDAPIQGATISILNSEGKVLIDKLLTKADGTFSVEAPLTTGEYVVRITHSTFKFYDFKIIINNQQLPGYRFRPR
ncbi:MAG: carboxypeptidase regulatory-like domain-containing protein [Candidatus Doudnabacteria bacterium]|nr:carboxypeptidase regulatory-like domain-containing protein [Candidatus Doudnabacteria bacterium]